MDRAPAAKAPQTVQVLDRSLNLIDFIASRRHPIALHEIARDTLLPPSTVHRLLRNLENHGYVERDQNNYWRLGFKFLEFGHLVRDRLPVREKALPLMHVLFEKTGADGLHCQNAPAGPHGALDPNPRTADRRARTRS